MKKFIKLFFDINKLETATNGKFLKVVINNAGNYIYTFSSLLGIKDGKAYLVVPVEKDFNVFVDNNGKRETLGKIRGEKLKESPFNLGEYTFNEKTKTEIELV